MEAFDKLPRDKRVKIMNAAFDCFGQNGYAKTSMYDIAAASRISKASLFRYFGTKKELYLYMFDSACSAIIKEMDEGTPDFFDCMRQATRTKMRVTARHPSMYAFLASVERETDKELLAAIMELNPSGVNAAYRKIFTNVNWAKLKTGIPKKVAMNLANYVTDGCLRDNVGKPGDEVMRELEVYYVMLRSVLYR
ncbi:MAG: TetR/AcrR family transcriptional regulator [Oscillospiraceae bacterium]|jgi:AcrR family transcriptional regulator|nr:TetR/AcrR family transcriptional regulator [Oscillospiraceae bacterium]